MTKTPVPLILQLWIELFKAIVELIGKLIDKLFGKK